MDWFGQQSLWLGLAAMTMIFAGLVSSHSVDEILDQAMLAASGRRSLPIMISADSSQGTYALGCKRNAFARQLPPGEWTAAALRTEIEAGTGYGEGYELKILRGILSAYRIDRLSTTMERSPNCS
jgi:hypothetical protein